MPGPAVLCRSDGHQRAGRDGRRPERARCGASVGTPGAPKGAAARGRRSWARDAARTTCCAPSWTPPTRWSASSTATGRILLANPALQRFTGRAGRRAARASGSGTSTSPPSTCVLAQDAVERAMATGIAHPQEGDWLTGDGERRRVAMRNTVLVDDEGLPYAIGCVGVDVTARPAAGGTAAPARADRPADRHRQPGRAVRRVAPAPARRGRAARCCSATSTSSRRSTTSTGTPSGTHPGGGGRAAGRRGRPGRAGRAVRRRRVRHPLPRPRTRRRCERSSCGSSRRSARRSPARRGR